MTNAASKTILVTGATGHQGSAAVRSLLTSGFRVKAITRSASSTKALRLKELGADVIEADLNNPASYADALKNVHGVFCVLTYEHGVDKEVRQGTALVNAASAANVRHFVYSSVIGADRDTGVPHWESKRKIETHLRASGLPFTVIRPNSFYENFLIPAVKSRIAKNKLASPVKPDVVQQFMSAEDVGKLVPEVFSKPDQHIDQIITLAAEELSIKQVQNIFSDVLKRDFKYAGLPMFMVRLLMGRDLYLMFKYVNSHDMRFVDDMDAMKQRYPDMKSLRSWITENFTSKS